MSSHALSGASHLSAVAPQRGVMRRVQENSRPDVCAISCTCIRIRAYVCMCNNARAGDRIEKWWKRVNYMERRGLARIDG